MREARVWQGVLTCTWTWLEERWEELHRDIFSQGARGTRGDSGGHTVQILHLQVDWIFLNFSFGNLEHVQSVVQGKTCKLTEKYLSALQINFRLYITNVPDEEPDPVA